jgi:hypothetical protein
MDDDWMDELVMTNDGEEVRVIDDEDLYVELSNGEYIEKSKLKLLSDSRPIQNE